MHGRSWWEGSVVLCTLPLGEHVHSKVLQRWLSVKRSVPGLDYLFLFHSTKLYIGLAVCLHHLQITHSSSCFKPVNVCGREREIPQHVLWSPASVTTDDFPSGSERVKSDSACTEQASLPPLLSLSIHPFLLCVCSRVYRGTVPSAGSVPGFVIITHNLVW